MTEYDHRSSVFGEFGNDLPRVRSPLPLLDLRAVARRRAARGTASRHWQQTKSSDGKTNELSLQYVALSAEPYSYCLLGFARMPLKRRLGPR